MPSQDQITYLQRPGNFVDGFALNSGVTPSPYCFQSMCFEGLSTIRIANNYRPKIYAIPDQSTFGGYPIPTGGNPPPGSPGMFPFTDFMTQVRMLPGTVILGMALVNVGGLNGFFLADNFYINVEDDATGIPFFSDWIAELMFNGPVLWNSVGNANVYDYVAKTCWLPLTRPRVIEAPGTITITGCYKATPGSSVNLAPQLILQCAEPCSVLRGVSECE